MRGVSPSLYGETPRSAFCEQRRALLSRVSCAFPKQKFGTPTRVRVHCGDGSICLACKEKVEHVARYQTFTKGKLVNKSQLIDALAARFEGNKKAAAHALESVLDTITREVA